jgi:hypothetical protein
MSEVIQALNELLEAERAGVEALVDLTRMSADRGEREMLQRMGGDAAWACAGLRAQVEALSGMPSRRVAPLLAHMRARDHFAARLRLFTQHQQALLENLRALLENHQVPPEARDFLVELEHLHVSNIAWCEQRAAALGVWEAPKDVLPPTPVTRGRIAGEGLDGSRRKRPQRPVSQERLRREASRADPLMDQ